MKTKTDKQFVRCEQNKRRLAGVQAASWLGAGSVSQTWPQLRTAAETAEGTVRWGLREARAG